MSDLHRAVQAEIDAFQPEHAPPYDDLAARRRPRVRGRAAAVAGAAALTVAAATAGGVLLSGGQDRLVPADGTGTVTAEPQKAAPPYRNRYAIRYDDEQAFRTSDQAVGACLALPGISDLGAQYSLPPIVNVAVTGLAEAEAFEACIRRVQGVMMTNEPARDLSRAAIRPGSEDSSRAARLEGFLDGDPGSGCLWVDTSGARVPLLLKGDALTVDFASQPHAVRRGGEIAATFGQRVVLAGGFGRSDSVPGCPVTGPAFLGVTVDPVVGGLLGDADPTDPASRERSCLPAHRGPSSAPPAPRDGSREAPAPAACG